MTAVKTKAEARIDALVLIRELREGIAAFVAKHYESVERLVSACDDNAWNDCVAYDMRDAISKLGYVMSSLVMWDREVSVTKEENDAIERRIAERAG